VDVAEDLADTLLGRAARVGSAIEGLGRHNGLIASSLLRADSDESAGIFSSSRGRDFRIEMQFPPTRKGRMATHFSSENREVRPAAFASDGMPAASFPWRVPAHGPALLEAPSEAAL